MRRRTLLGACAAAALAAGCSSIETLTDPRGDEIARDPGALGERDELLLRRATFFPTARERSELKRAGREGWLDSQLAAPMGARSNEGETTGLTFRLSSLESLVEGGMELRDLGAQEVRQQLQQSLLLRACYSRWQLRERLVQFFSDHFNLYEYKDITHPENGLLNAELLFYIADDHRSVLREHALGRFEDLLEASMRSPAMLGYLDNQLSHKKHPNENYARELLELHTLGVGGGYSQKDVMEVARCLTGWGIEHEASGLRARLGSLRFDKSRHDEGEKIVLGQRIPAGGGAKDAALVRRILAAHPSTARFLATKLTRFFWGEGAPAGLVTSVANAFTRANGQIAAAVKALFLAPEFGEAPALLRRPFEFTVAAIRASGALSDGGEGVQRHLTAMGHSPFAWPMPDGYPTRTTAWTGSLLARFNFALALASGEIEGTQIEDTQRAATALAVPAKAATLPAGERIALALACPEFQWS